MPQPDRLLTTLRRATEACLTTPGRTGRIVSLIDAADVLVVGDLHGHLPNFSRVLQIAELARQPRRHLVVQELIHSQFRYDNGGDKSHQLVDLFAALKCQYPDRVHYLLGNHELAQMTNRRVAKDDDDLNVAFVEGARRAYGSLADDIVAAYYDLFAAVPLAIRTPNRVLLSHSLPSATALKTFRRAALEVQPSEPMDQRPGGSVYAVVWGRDTRQATVDEYLKIMDADLLISGHIACPDNGYAVPNEQQLILDALGHPAAACLFPADRPVPLDELASTYLVML